MKKRNTDRIPLMDTARGIATLLMMIGHMEIPAGLTQFIYSFHMPLFFIISGMLMKKEDNLLPFIRKRIRRILVPYFVFSLIFTNLNRTDWLNCLYGSSMGLRAAGSLTSLWFLPCLFCADLVFHLILSLCREEKAIIAASLACGAAGIAITRFLGLGNNLPFSFDIALAAVPFLLTGYLLRRHADDLKRFTDHPHWNVLAGLAMMGLVSVLCFWNLPPSSVESEMHVEMAIGSYGNLFLFFFTAVLGSFSVLLISKAVGGRLKMITDFGRCTIPCLVIHRSVFALVLQIGQMLNLSTPLILLAQLILTIVLTFAGQALFERYAPNLIGIIEEPCPSQEA